MDDPDEDATATINYTSGTTARPKGVQLTHRNFWLNATAFGWQTGVTDRDVYLHTLPMFHCNGWGMPYAVTGMGGRHIVLRKVDGAEILRRVDEHGVTLLCGAPAVVATILDAAQEWDGEIPGRGRTRIVVAGAPPPTRTIERVETELGWEFIQIYGLTETAPLLTMNRGRAEYDDLDPAERAARLGRAGAPALGVRAARRRRMARCWPAATHVMEGYWEQPEETAEALADGWFHTGDGGDDRRRATTSSIADRKKDVIISGGENVSSIEVEDSAVLAPGRGRGVRDRRARREVGRDGDRARRARARRVGDRERPDRALPGTARALQVPEVASSSATCSPAPRPASSRSSSCARPTGKAASAK